MNDKIDKNRPLNKKEIDLWKSLTKDVQPYQENPYQEALNAPSYPKKPEITETIPLIPSPKPKKNAVSLTLQAIDMQTRKKLKRGQIKVEARLDLHGQNREEAHTALNHFINQSQNRGLGCVLVITGKGRTGIKSDDVNWLTPKPGVLKRAVPEWLSTPPLSNAVLSQSTAMPKDGGSGALYVCLRKHK